MSEQMEAVEHPWYHARVLELESEGCCTSDAQGVADAEYANELRGLRQANKTLRAQRDRLKSCLQSLYRMGQYQRTIENGKIVGNAYAEARKALEECA